MSNKILYVDDEPNILASIKRSLGKKFDIVTAEGGENGLKAMKSEGSFAVVVTDMRMPGMDGIEFLSQAGKLAPETVFMMLTGNTDQQTAMDAVNKGQIFRFLTKPCPPDVLIASMNAGLDQYRLVTAERELLQETLTGSMKVLIEVLSLSVPKAFEQSNRLKPIIKTITEKLELSQSWQYEIAGMLSQIGFIVLPDETIEKIFSGTNLNSAELEMYRSHPAQGKQLLEHIPRLENCAAMIERQLERFDNHGKPDLSKKEEMIPMGAQILHATLDFEKYLARGLSQKGTFTKMREDEGKYNPDVLDVLKTISLPGRIEEQDIDDKVQELSVWKLSVGMYVNDNITTKSHALLVPKGSVLTPSLLTRLKNFASGVGIEEPIRVIIPEEQPSENLQMKEQKPEDQLSDAA